MLKKSFIILFLFLFAGLYATESRIESMGKRDLFFRDDMSIFYNPANIGVFGNFVTGSLGFVNDVRDTEFVNPRVVYTRISDTSVVSSVEVDTVVKRKTATPTNQWFGVVYNYQINNQVGVFGGAAFNRVDEFLNLYENLRGQKKYRTDHIFPSLKGKSDYIIGGKVKDINFGIGYYSASQNLIEEANTYDVSVSLSKINAGVEMGLGEHSLEVFGGMGMITYSNSSTNTTSSVYNIKETTDNSMFGGARFFYQTKLGRGLIFVPALKYTSLALFDLTDTRVSGGMGINYRLDGGLFWAGVEGESFSTEDSVSTVSGAGARFNFGIEKSLIFKWLQVRIGGMKFIGSQDVKTKSTGITTTEWIENPIDDGMSDDFLGFGIGVNYQNRLRFDITLNESLPYFNPFGNGLQNSSNGGHMLLRISSTFSL